jgi:hypothetical protein
MTITYAPLPLCRPTLRREARAGRGAAREGAITRRQDERRDRRRGGGRWSRYRLMNGAWIGALVGVALALIAAAPAAATPNRVDPFAHAAAREPKPSSPCPKSGVRVQLGRQARGRAVPEGRADPAWGRRRGERQDARPAGSYVANARSAQPPWVVAEVMDRQAFPGVGARPCGRQRADRCAGAERVLAWAVTARPGANRSCGRRRAACARRGSDAVSRGEALLLGWLDRDGRRRRQQL